MTRFLAAFSTARESASLGCILANIHASGVIVVCVWCLRHLVAALTPVFVCSSHVFKACFVLVLVHREISCRVASSEAVQGKWGKYLPDMSSIYYYFICFRVYRMGLIVWWSPTGTCMCLVVEIVGWSSLLVVGACASTGVKVFSKRDTVDGHR